MNKPNISEQAVSSNLIERLGGYEAAKTKCDQADKHGYKSINVPYERGFADAHKETVRAALLEYRRQHGIFDVGDVVVYSDNAKYVSVNDFEQTYCVKEVYKNFIVAEGGSFLFLTMCNDEINHATDAEIAANRRIDKHECDGGEA